MEKKWSENNMNVLTVGILSFLTLESYSLLDLYFKKKLKVLSVLNSQINKTTFLTHFFKNLMQTFCQRFKCWCFRKKVVKPQLNYPHWNKNYKRPKIPVHLEGMNLSIYLSTDLSIYLSIYLSIHLSFYLGRSW